MIHLSKKYFKGIRLTIIKFIGLSTVIFFGAFLIFQYINTQQINETRELQEEEIRSSLNSIIRVKTEYLESILIDYACYDWMIDFIKSPHTHDPAAYITTTQHLKLSTVQVFDLNKKIVYVDNSGFLWRDTLFFNNKFFNKLSIKRTMRFFMDTPEGIVEIFASTVHGSEDFDRKTKPEGYIIIGKLWNFKYMQELSNVLKANIILDKRPDQEGRTIFSLKGSDNKILGYINYTKTSAYEESLNNLKRYLNVFFVVLCVTLLIIMLLIYDIVVIKPITIIENALDTQSPSVLEHILKKKNEFASIALLIINYFSNKELMNNKINEVQKARDELKYLYSTLLSQKGEIELQKEELRTNSENLAKANEQILSQKSIVEEQNTQITESIVYASMIQNAVLTPQFDIDEAFAEHFIMFMPKGIVSGDFYWFKENGGKYFFSCADCTGHGLSGALMSMLGISILNEIILDFDHTTMNAASVLNDLRANIVKTLHQTGEIGEIHDGMDIVLCIYDPSSHIIEFAAAYNPLYHVTTDDLGQPQLVEHKGDNMPVGIHDRSDPFTNRQILTKPGDIIYLFSDGYVDQFGDQTKKKFNKNNFKNLIMSFQSERLTEQKRILIERFNEWKKDVEQIDDVSVIGIRF